MATVKPNTPNRQTRKVDGDHDRIRVNPLDIDQLLDLSARRRPFTEVHFDANYAAATEWKRLLVDSTLTIAMLTGMSVRTVSAKVVANLGWDKVHAPQLPGS